MRIRALDRLAVKPHHLLSRGVRESRQDARFGHRGVTLVFENTAHRNAFMPEGAQQQLSRLIVAHDSNRQDVHSEVGKIVDGIRAAARNHRAITVLQDQHGRFARDPRNLAEDEFVGHQVREHGDRELGKRFDDLPQPVVFLNVFCHQYAGLFAPTLDFLTSGPSISRSPPKWHPQRQ